MKTLTLILLILLCSIMGITTAQVTVSGAADGANLVKGSAPTQYQSAIDYMLSINSVTNNREIGIYFEHFPKIHFMNWGMRFNYGILYEENIHALIGFQAGQIIRKYPEKAHVGYLNGGGVAEVRYFIGRIGITVIYTYIYRTDQDYWNADAKWVGSLFGGIIYKFPEL